MYNLIMISSDWSSGTETINLSRLFEYTDDRVALEFGSRAAPQIDKLIELPCLFMEEGTDSEKAYVGRINRMRINGTEVRFEYEIDTRIPPLSNEIIHRHRTTLDIQHDFEFSRNHWAIKDADLYKFILHTTNTTRQRPKVFSIPEYENIEKSLASAMMPFEGSFSAVYTSIKEAATSVGLNCRRADDIWENSAIIQDVVSLIDKSRIVICDCSGRNPNVFYEAGIAHTLGREVILITQSEHDIPFDLRHIRYIRYHNNGEGRETLKSALKARMETILGH